MGGTALALQIGHRRSTDLELFGKLDVDSNEVPAVLLKTGEPITFLKNSTHIHIALIKGIKTDIVNYPYPWLEEINHADQWRLAGLKDIAAMKLAAITGRGTKKDFFDLYFLLKTFSLRQMIGFYEQKYPDGSVFLVLKSLAYFADAETNAMPLMIVPTSWPDVKNTILTQLKEIAVGY